MLLAIDTGNTNVKFALVDDAGEIVQRWRIATDARRTATRAAGRRAVRHLAPPDLPALPGALSYGLPSACPAYGHLTGSVTNTE